MKVKTTLITVALLAAVSIPLFFCSYTPRINSKNGIAEIRKIELGGIQQWLLIRGQGIDKPVLLFLHGGAGTSEMGLVRKYNNELEQHFVVVNWDQRAAGKSCTREARASELSVDRFVKDTLELTEYLRRTLKQEKIFLVGHSWGSIIGMMAIEQRPEYYHAYVGTGQMSNIPRQERLGYKMVLDLAVERGIEKAVDELGSIGAPNRSGRYIDGMKGTAIERKWVTKLGGFFYAKSSMLPQMLELFACPEYSGLDCCRFLRGMTFSQKNKMMEHEVFELNLNETIPEVEVPVYFFLGRHDLNAPSTVSAEYLQNLIAPAKHLVWFENSAHSPCFEEAMKFNWELILLKADYIACSEDL